MCLRTRTEILSTLAVFLSIPILVLDYDRIIDRNQQAHLLVDPISRTYAAHTKLDLQCFMSLLIKPFKGVFPIVLVSTASRKSLIHPRIPSDWAFLPMPITSVGQALIRDIKRNFSRKRHAEGAGEAVGDTSADWRVLRSSPCKKVAESPSGAAAAAASSSGAAAPSRGAAACSSGAAASSSGASRQSRRGRGKEPEHAPEEPRKRLRLTRNTQVSEKKERFRMGKHSYPASMVEERVQGKGQGVVVKDSNPVGPGTVLGPFIGRISSADAVEYSDYEWKYILRVRGSNKKKGELLMYSPPSVCPLARLNEPDHGERANCHLIKFALADAMDTSISSGDDVADERSLLWVVTDRGLPRQGLESEEATIFYGEEYDRTDYPEGYWARPARPQGRPTAKTMGGKVLRYCAEHNVDCALLARKYGT